MGNEFLKLQLKKEMEKVARLWVYLITKELTQANNLKKEEFSPL